MLLVIISWNTLSPLLLGHQWPFHIVPQAPHTVLVFVLFFSSLLLRLENVYQFGSTFKFYWGYPLKKQFLLKISDVLLFSSKVFTWFFFMISIFLLRTFFPSFLKVFTCTSCMVIPTVALNSLKSLIILTSEWTPG